jgi:hypothetical protein
MTLYFASLFWYSLSLRISKNNFRRWLTHFQLRANFLNLRCLLFELRDHGLHSWLFPSAVRGQTVSLQFGDCAGFDFNFFGN